MDIRYKSKSQKHKTMKNIKWLSLVAMAVIALSSCEKKEPINTTDIVGKWVEQDEGRGGEHMRFLTADEEAKEGDYFFGKEWDEGDDVYEDDLKYKGNGWFKWKIDGTTLSIIEHMDAGWADVPKTYTIDKLTATELVIYEPDEKKDKDTYRKVQ